MTEPQNAIGAPKDADSGSKKVFKPLFYASVADVCKAEISANALILPKIGIAGQCPF
jgi:hypothetical protein